MLHIKRICLGLPPRGTLDCWPQLPEVSFGKTWELWRWKTWQGHSRSLLLKQSRHVPNTWDPGWGWNPAFLTSSQGILMLLVWSTLWVAKLQAREKAEAEAQGQGTASSGRGTAQECGARWEVPKTREAGQVTEVTAVTFPQGKPWKDFKQGTTLAHR